MRMLREQQEPGRPFAHKIRRMEIMEFLLRKISCSFTFEVVHELRESQ